MKPIPEELKAQALAQLQDEVNDFTIYSILANKCKKDDGNRDIFLRLCEEEKNHYEFCKKITGEDRKPQKLLILFIVFCVNLFGVYFVLKFMENREISGKSFYKYLFDSHHESKIIYEQEINHEAKLIDMLYDKKIVYAGAIVLGMNDALVELTGTLSGIALAFSSTIAVGATGLIMGIAASLSMAGSAYLESKENEIEGIKPLTYSLYTGVAYIITTIMLVLPFLVLDSMLFALIWMFVFVLIAIFGYNFYISIAKGLNFWRRVTQMCAITFGVAIISFAIGYSVKYIFGIDI
ncbi:MAG: VIT1/CCC1 family protein [Campylobacteraceae bacterium]|jgi:VIT1/CCC1 family predicted Fe2+/Mn2+ transporter|nr:VIT1/CCC1 family protein [Campylobacteraceae bacterium]